MESGAGSRWRIETDLPVYTCFKERYAFVLVSMG